MPVIYKYNLSEIPNIEDIITAVVIYFAISNNQFANLSFRFFFSIHAAKIETFFEISKSFSKNIAKRLKKPHRQARREVEQVHRGLSGLSPCAMSTYISISHCDRSGQKVKKSKARRFAGGYR